MKTSHYCLFVLMITITAACNKEDLPTVNNLPENPAASSERLASNYNSAFYTTVLSAAQGIANPFLIQQGYITSTGVTVNGNTLTQDGIVYTVSQSYQNPSTSALYYLYSADYGSYGISSFSPVWPTKCPNVFYNSSTHTYFASVDCVGFGSRLLSAVGSGSTTNNAYVNLKTTIKAINASPFASLGYVATAYQFAVGFPVLTSANSTHWQYVSGNVSAADVNTYNHQLSNTVGNYTGVRKGGFASSVAGDILAFGYGSTSSSNGHFMVMETAPQLLDANGLHLYYPSQSIATLQTFLNTNKMYAIKVYDDSGQNAHAFDSRTNTSGIGHGTVLIATATTDDAPMGYVFKPSSAVSVHWINSTTVLAISVGRCIGYNAPLNVDPVGINY